MSFPPDPHVLPDGTLVKQSGVGLQ